MDADHSREPWRVGGVDGSSGCGPCIVSDHGVNPAWGADDVAYYGGHLVADSVCRPDARRIVAAVNACQGIPTNKLEMIVRAGRRLTAQGEPLPSAEEVQGWQRFLFGHLTKKAPTAPGLYLVVSAKHSMDRIAVEVSQAEIDSYASGGSPWPGIEWWWSEPMTNARLAPPHPNATDLGNGNERQPGEEG